MASVFDELRSAMATLERVVERLEPGTLDVTGAKKLVNLFTRCERLSVAGRGMGSVSGPRSGGLEARRAPFRGALAGLDYRGECGGRGTVAGNRPGVGGLAVHRGRVPGQGADEGQPERAAFLRGMDPEEHHDLMHDVAELPVTKYAIDWPEYPTRFRCHESSTGAVRTGSAAPECVERRESRTVIAFEPAEEGFIPPGD